MNKKMSELDQVRLCAKAMGCEVWEASQNKPCHTIRFLHPVNADDQYWPITNDAQAMALVKRFMLKIDAFTGTAEISWDGNVKFKTYSDLSLNHAIVECVALMQSEK
jgi:hypothetical protein